MTNMHERGTDKRLMVACLVVGFLAVGVVLMLVTGVFSR